QECLDQTSLCSVRADDTHAAVGLSLRRGVGAQQGENHVPDQQTMKQIVARVCSQGHSCPGMERGSIHIDQGRRTERVGVMGFHGPTRLERVVGIEELIKHTTDRFEHTVLNIEPNQGRWGTTFLELLRNSSYLKHVSL